MSQLKTNGIFASENLMWLYANIVLMLEDIFVFFPGNWINLDKTWQMDGFGSEPVKFLAEALQCCREMDLKAIIFSTDLPLIHLITSPLLIFTKLGTMSDI